MRAMDAQIGIGCVLVSPHDGRCTVCRAMSCGAYLPLLFCPACKQGFCGYDLKRHRCIALEQLP